MSRTAGRVAASVVLATLSLLACQVFAEVEITHDPPEDVRAGMRIALQAEVEDEAAGVELVRAYFRAGGGAEYVYADMSRSADDENEYAGTLPALAPDAGTLDYFLLVKSGDGNVVKSQNYTLSVAEGSAAPVSQVVLEPSRFAAVEGYHGKLVRLVGDVQVVDAGGIARAAGDVGYVVRESETLRTGRDGRVVVDFDGDPITVLEEASRLNVKTPSWLTHIAGRAYFAFRRLLDVGQQPRTVASTVALIGIRGTNFLNYAQIGVALEEGTLGVESLADNADAPIVLNADRFGRIDGPRVIDQPLSAANRAHIERAKAFLAGAPVDSITVTAEAVPLPTALPGVQDNVRLVSAAQVLGLAAATSTVAAGTGGIGTTGVALGVLAGAALIGSAGGGGGGGGDDDGDTPPDTKGSPFVGITVSFTGSLDGPNALLEATDTCGNTINSTTGPVSCNGATASFLAFENPPGSFNSNISWSPDPVSSARALGSPGGSVPPGRYDFDVIYGGNPGGSLPYVGGYVVSPNPEVGFSGTLTSFAERQSYSFNVP